MDKHEFRGTAQCPSTQSVYIKGNQKTYHELILQVKEKKLIKN